jgi:hypothetical protein
MKKRFIKVPEIQLKSFKRASSLPGKGERRAATCCLILKDCISMDNILIEMDGFMMPRQEKEFVCHNDAMGDSRFCDYPVHHLGKRKPKRFLYEHVAIGMNEFLNERSYNSVRDFLEKRTDSLEDSEFYRPSTWKGALRIPVHFIHIYGMKGRYGITLANIMIGHHLWVNNVQIYPVFKPEGRIFDKVTIAEIQRLLSRKKVKETLGYYARTNNFDYNGADEIKIAIPGCNLKKIPLVRFY